MEAVIGIDVEVRDQADLDFLCDTIARILCPLAPPHEQCVREFSFAARIKHDDELMGDKMDDENDPAYD